MRITGKEDPFALAEEIEARHRVLDGGAQILEMPERPAEPPGESRIEGVAFDGYIHRAIGNGLGPDVDEETVRAARRTLKPLIRLGRAASYQYVINKKGKT